MRARIYTDGACSGNPGPGGWACILLLPNSIQEIYGSEVMTTNNRMELLAAIEGLKLANKLGYKKVDVYSDSAYVVNALKNGWLARWQQNGWQTVSGDEVKNRDLWIRYLRLARAFEDVNLIKVKGHSDNRYNNQCDRLAKREVERLKAPGSSRNAFQR